MGCGERGGGEEHVGMLFALKVIHKPQPPPLTPSYPFPATSQSSPSQPTDQKVTTFRSGEFKVYVPFDEAELEWKLEPEPVFDWGGFVGVCKVRGGGGDVWGGGGGWEFWKESRGGGGFEIVWRLRWGGVSEGSEGVIAGWVTGASVCGLRNKEVFYEVGDDAFVLVYSSERDQSLDAVKVTSVRMW